MPKLRATLRQVQQTNEDNRAMISLSGNLQKYVDEDGYAWCFARTLNPSDGSAASVVNCDFVQCLIQVDGSASFDVVSYRNVTMIDVPLPNQNGVRVARMDF